MKHILVIGGKDHTYMRMIDMGFRFSAVQSEVLVSGYQKQNASNLIVADYTKLELFRELVIQTHLRDPFDFVVSFSEFSQEAASEIALDLEIPTNCNRSSIANTRDKYLMRTLLEESNVATVNFSLIESLDQLETFFEENNRQVIVKPASGAGSKGVFYLDKKGDAAKALSYCLSANYGAVLAEAYVGGREYSVETISRQGVHELVAITEKSTTGPPNFIETGHCMPADINPLDSEKIFKVVEEVLLIVEHQFGPAHTEVKVLSGQVFVIETQLRFGGDQIWEMVLGVTGVDLVIETLSELTGLKRLPRLPKFKSMGIHFLTNLICENEIRDLVSQFSLQNNLIRLQLEKRKLITKPQHSGERLGYLLFGFDSVDGTKTLAPLLKALEKGL